jgi:hypothetical protein
MADIERLTKMQRDFFFFHHSRIAHASELRDRLQHLGGGIR